MKSNQAKEILLRYRPGTSDDNDPDVRAALEQASRDPELAAWREDHEKLQSEIRAGFQRLRVPAGLREQILSEKRARVEPWRGVRQFATAALTLGLVVAAILLWTRGGVDPEVQFAAFRSRMVSSVLRGYSMDLQTATLSGVRSYLATNEAPSELDLPPALEAAPLLGCAVIPWRNQPAAMICYGEGTAPDMWLFVMDRNAFPDSPPETRVRVARVKQLTTIAWTSEGMTYLLAADIGEDELRRLAKPRI